MDEVERYKKLVEELREELRIINKKQANSVQNRKDTIKKKLADGKIITKNVPSWLSVDEDRKVWSIIPEKVRVIERVFKLASRGLSPLVIANRLTDTTTPNLVSASAWDAALVMSIMQNSAVIGELRSKAGELEKADYYPVVIKPEIFALVQDHIALRKGGGGTSISEVTTLFSGLLKCECGSNMRYVSQGGNVLPYVVCKAAFTAKTCSAERLPYGPLEDQVMLWICEDQQFDMRVNRPVSDDPRALIQQEIRDAKRELEKKQKSLLLGNIVALTINQSMVDLMKKIEDLEEKFRSTPPKFIRSGSEETLKLWNEHNESKGNKRLTYRLRLQAAVRSIISTITVSLKSVEKDGVTVRPLVLTGPVFRLVAANKSVVNEFDQKQAISLYEHEGIEFNVVLNSK